LSDLASGVITKRQPVRAFLSYAHADDQLREEFVKALRQLQREQMLEVWHDRRILPGDEWAGIIDDRLTSADIVILLVSVDFLSSDYCNEIELETALERHQERKTRVVPVILRPCDWENARFGKLQALPAGGKPITKWEPRDDGFLNAVQGLRLVIKDLQNEPQDSGPSQIPSLSKMWNRPAFVGMVMLAIALGFGGFWGIRQLRAERSSQLVAQGDVLWDQQQYNQAEALYYQARDLDANNASAYFGLGLSDDLKNDAKGAIAMYEKAVSLAGLPQYKMNLADSYFKVGRYQSAVAMYSGIAESPYAALESAKINRLRGLLYDSEEQGRTALRWLNDLSVGKRPENELEWYFTTNEKIVKIIKSNEKVCYAQFELSITLFLSGKASEATKYAEAGRQSCADRLSDLEVELRPELQRLANERPELAGLCKAYPQRFLQF
jgi:tetratricopeptide (TPR) repeat protein